MARTRPGGKKKAWGARQLSGFSTTTHSRRRTDVVVPPRELGVASGRSREGSLGDEVVGLVVKVVLEVVAEKEGEEGRLEVVVVTKGGSSLSCKKGSTSGRKVVRPTGGKERPWPGSLTS